ncbi:hypothetical protein RI129_009306 [Pyrocoelia pectoralis]|uniref:Uncharacterized protein n=1 Tax=Pyrocoelia pectoralis TaxID=417401 RepID=A0AAN7VC88_9COLE
MFKTPTSLGLLIILKYSSQCLSPSFDNVLITVNEKEEKIRGCITPDTLKFKGEVTKISAVNQNIPDLNRGAVRDISTKFNIDFSRNNIEIIREEAFLNLSSLDQMDLSRNNIIWISENAFVNLPTLRLLYLAHNKISVSPRAFNNLPKLRVIDLSDNNLDSFDQSWFYRTPSLDTISFRLNRLRSIPRAAFINFPSINNLYFHSNEIENIHPDAFKGLRNLRQIIISENRVKSFEINFHTPSELGAVGIQFNNITYISDKMLEMIRPNLRSFWITGNPWQCGCFDKLINWSIKNRVTISFVCLQYEYVCVYPKTNPYQCLEREDADFYNGFSNNFGNDTKCKPHWSK